MAIDPMTPSTLYVGTYNGNVFKSTDSGKNWSEKFSGLSAGNINELRIDPLSPAVLYMGTSNIGVLKSVDHGDTWTSANNGLTYSDITPQPRQRFMLER